MRWFKSSYSADSGDCVEVCIDQAIMVRDSKDPNGPVLEFSKQSWREFIKNVPLPVETTS
jgi:hypothetical protein